MTENTKLFGEGGCSFAVSIDELPLIQSALNLTNHFIDWSLHDKLINFKVNTFDYLSVNF